MKTVLVTGASGGIGQAVALDLAKNGYGLALHYRSGKAKAEALAAAVRALGAEARLIAFDLTDRDATRAAIEADMAAHGVYHGVVCNAGIHDDNPFPLLDGGQWDRVIRTDLDGVYNVLHPIVMPMVSARIRGRIVAIASLSGQIGNRGQVNYSAAKAGVIGAAKALAVELARHKITVNCVSPGVIETEMLEGLPVDEIKKAIPMRRFGRPEEVASLVTYLMGESAAYITRQVIAVNGGLI